MKAVIFDLDNTLFHYNPCNTVGLKAAWKVYGKGSLSDFCKRIEHIRQDLFLHIYSKVGCHSRLIYFQRMLEQDGILSTNRALRMHNAYWKAFLAHAKPFPFATQLLAECKRLGLKTAMLSDQACQAQLLKIQKLGLRFDVVVTSEEAGVDKPDPRAFDLVLEKLGVGAHEALMVGDNLQRDMAAPMKTIWVNIKAHDTPDFGEPVKKPTWTVQNLKQIVGILQLLNKN